MKYRIIKKKGEQLTGCKGGHDNLRDVVTIKVFRLYCNCNERYVPKYIVQSQKHNEGTIKLGCCYSDFKELWKDEKEFNNIAEARKYKRDLELIDGIVIE